MTWRRNLESWRTALAPRCPDLYFEIGPPAHEDEIRGLEDALGKACPQELRTFLTRETGHINFWWSLDGNPKIIQAREQPTDGYIEFNLATMANIDPGAWMDAGMEPHEEVVGVWRNAWAFMASPNGDMIALDTAADTNTPPVVYLDHEQPEVMWRLAPTFGKFMETFTALGCVGPESWTLVNFATESGAPVIIEPGGDPRGLLDAACPNAVRLRTYFGVFDG